LGLTSVQILMTTKGVAFGFVIWYLDLNTVSSTENIRTQVNRALVHAQGIVHRDIKPDNCLITNENVLKIVDFGVSEMFAKDSDMNTTKSAGSPAFMPPELCVAKHGEVSGRACDIWSMGATLYCFAFGYIPFEKSNMIDLFGSIKSDGLVIPDSCEPDLKDLLQKLLEKDPQKRIQMDDIRVSFVISYSIITS